MCDFTNNQNQFTNFTWSHLKVHFIKQRLKQLLNSTHYDSLSSHGEKKILKITNKKKTPQRSAILSITNSMGLTFLRKRSCSELCDLNADGNSELIELCRLHWHQPFRQSYKYDPKKPINYCLCAITETYFILKPPLALLTCKAEMISLSFIDQRFFLSKREKNHFRFFRSGVNFFA